MLVSLDGKIDGKFFRTGDGAGAESPMGIIPKSTHKERMEQKRHIWGFRLGGEDMAEIAKLDIGHSEIVDHSDPGFVKMLHSMKIHE